MAGEGALLGIFGKCGVVTLLTGVVTLLTAWIISSLYIVSPIYHRMDESSDTAFREKNMTAFILGATGEVGKELVKEVLRRNVFQRVVLIGRRQLEYDEPQAAALEQIVVDFDKLEEHQSAFEGAAHGFCCLGTTRGKAGADGFVKVDYDYVLHAAQLARAAGCAHFHLVSASGASLKSPFLYPQTKGKIEEELKKLDFPRLSIYRPAILQCNRVESRPAEAVIRWIMKPLAAVTNTGQIPTSAVAAAMVNVAVSERSEPVATYENKDLHNIVTPTKPKEKAEPAENAA